MPLLHAFCATVCSAVVVDLADAPSLDFLAALPTRVIYSAQEQNDSANKTERKKEVANLVLLRKAKNRESVADLRRNSKEV
jgi:hypothetical protein